MTLFVHHLCFPVSLWVGELDSLDCCFVCISITFKKNVTSKNKQNSNQENKAIQPKGEQESKDDVQTESSGTSEDKEVSKGQEKTE